MNRFKFQAMVREFPFLADLAGEDYANCKRISIKRADKELMSKIPHYSGATGSLVSIHDSEQVHFGLMDGTLIRDAVKGSGDVIHNEAYTDDEYWEGETVLEAIDRHDVAQRLKYIVINRCGHIIRDHHSQDGFYIEVYKTPKSLSFTDLITAEIEQATARVQAEAAF